MDTVIIVAGMNHPIPIMNADYIGVDEGLAFCLNQKIKPVIAIGDFDSTDINLYPDIPFVQYSSEKDETDLELAIEYAKQRYKKIIVCNCLGGRIDHELYNIKLLIKNPEIEIYDMNQKLFVLKKGKYKIKNSHRYFSFFAIEETKLSLINFKYSINSMIFTPKDFKTISNEMNTDCGEVDIEYGKILCIQCD